MRMTQIMQPQPKLSKGRRLVTAALISTVLIPLTTAQIAFSAPAAEFTMTFLPVEGRLTSPFGQRPDPFSDKTKFHSGMDIAAPLGTIVRTPAKGTVTRAEMYKGYGNLIEIDHGNGTVTRYGKLDSFAVKAGDNVSKGQTIGEVGQSGRATGPHLHFEVIQNGENKDPQSFLSE